MNELINEYARQVPYEQAKVMAVHDKVMDLLAEVNGITVKDISDDDYDSYFSKALEITQLVLK